MYLEHYIKMLELESLRAVQNSDFEYSERLSATANQVRATIDAEFSSPT
jgi:hypothetical protein